MIIGLCGLIGSGKSTVGDILITEYGFKRDSFAAALKDAAAVMFNWDRALLEGDTKESREWREITDPFWTEKLGKEISPRVALQLLGTEAGRNVFGLNLWSAGVEKRYLDSGKTKTVITDARFPNEIASIVKLGGRVAQISRGPNPDWYGWANDYNYLLREHAEHEKTKSAEPPKAHPSEWAWIGHPGITIQIENNFSLGDLHLAVKHLVTALKI